MNYYLIMVTNIRDMGITRMLNRNPPASRSELVINVMRIVSSVTYKYRDLSFSQNLCSSLILDVSFISPENKFGQTFMDASERTLVHTYVVTKVNFYRINEYENTVAIFSYLLFNSNSLMQHYAPDIRTDQTCTKQVKSMLPLSQVNLY